METLQIERLVLGSVQTNCYYLYRKGHTEAVCIDPADRGADLYAALKEQGLSVQGILLTHGHFDHILGVKQLRDLAGCKVYAYEGEQELLADATMNVSAQMSHPVSIEADILLRDSERVTIADMTCTVIATPGHTAGSCCYYYEAEGVLFSGDTLFQESVGRTDFPTGSSAALGRSLREKLMILPENVKVYPGHGDETTIGYEARYNPYC
ncbi:MAG: MBL fold metallo-hydrolase [Lachnospiraceae bacterium]